MLSSSYVAPEALSTVPPYGTTAENVRLYYLLLSKNYGAPDMSLLVWRLVDLLARYELCEPQLCIPQLRALQIRFFTLHHTSAGYLRYWPGLIDRPASEPLHVPAFTVRTKVLRRYCAESKLQSKTPVQGLQHSKQTNGTQARRTLRL